MNSPQPERPPTARSGKALAGPWPEVAARAGDLGLTGLVLLALLALLGTKSRWVGLLAVCYPIAAAGLTLRPLTIPEGVAPGLRPWLDAAAAGLFALALLALALTAAARLLVVPLPGRDDNSTFVEL